MTRAGRVRSLYLRRTNSIADEGLAVLQDNGVQKDHPADPLGSLHCQQLQPHSRHRVPNNHRTCDGLLLHKLQAQQENFWSHLQQCNPERSLARAEMKALYITDRRTHSCKLFRYTLTSSA